MAAARAPARPRSRRAHPPPAAPPSPVLTKDGRDQTLHVLLEFYIKKLEDLHQRTKDVEKALRTKIGLAFRLATTLAFK